jgi:hypothetical protein
LAAELRLHSTITVTLIRRRESVSIAANLIDGSAPSPGWVPMNVSDPDDMVLTARTLSSHMRLTWSQLTPTSQELPGFLTDFGLKFSEFGNFAIG